MVLYLILAVTALAAGIIKTGFGVGAGIFLTPLLALMVGAKQAVGLMSPMMLITDVVTLYVFWGKWDWKQIKVILPGTVLGTIFGAYYLSWASPSVAKITIGIIAIVFSSITVFKSKNPTAFQNFKVQLWHGVLTSFFSGIASAIANAGGVVVTIYLVSAGLSKEAFIATLVSVLLISDISKFVLYTHLNILTMDFLLMGLALTPVMLLGSWLGKKLLERLNEKQYVLYINVLVFISGIILLINH